MLGRERGKERRQESEAEGTAWTKAYRECQTCLGKETRPGQPEHGISEDELGCARLSSVKVLALASLSPGQLLMAAEEGSSTGAVVESPPAKAGGVRDAGSIPGSGRSPGGGSGHPLQYSCLGHPMTEEPGGLPTTGSPRVRHG